MSENGGTMLGRYLRLIVAGVVLAIGFLTMRFECEAAEVGVSIQADQVKNNDFAQLMGGYLLNRGNSRDPGSATSLNSSGLINAYKGMMPSSVNGAEFDSGTVVRVHSFQNMEPNDYFGLTNDEVVDIIKFCKATGCEPMFGAYGLQDAKTTMDIGGGVMITGYQADTSYEKIKARAKFVKDQCKAVWGNDNHCKVWDIGNEPPANQGNCDYYGKTLIPTATKAVLSEIPNAVFHAPELFRYESKVKDTSTMLTECIIDAVNKTDPNVRIDMFTVHWYPYTCGEGDSVYNVDGNALLKWDGFGVASQKMTHPYSIVSGTRAIMEKYGTTRGARIGVGELNPSGACVTSSSASEGEKITAKVNQSWGSAFWHLDEMGILAEAGVSHISKHTHVAPGSGVYTVIMMGSSNPILLPNYWAYRFSAKYFAKRVVGSTSDKPQLVNSHAGIDKQGNLRIMLINKSGSGFKPGGSPPSDVGAARGVSVRINLANFSYSGQQAEVYKLTAYGNNFADGTKPTDESQVISAAGSIGIGREFEYTVPAYSAVIIKVPGSGGQSYPTAVPTTAPPYGDPTSTPRPAGPTPTRNPNVTPTSAPVGCSGGCYGSLANCTTNCGFTCPKLSAADTKTQCGWDNAVAYRCCSQGTNPAPTNTRAPTTPTRSISPTNTPTGPIPTRGESTPTPTLAPVCPKKGSGDANCDGVVNISDFGVWKMEFIQSTVQRMADFNGDGRVTIADFGSWKVGFLGR
ncbi:MAG: dockerin type I domain-containing protein [Candidatus Shapirobacteria bacterium]|jgi:hypothetical protein